MSSPPIDPNTSISQDNDYKQAGKGDGKAKRDNLAHSLGSQLTRSSGAAAQQNVFIAHTITVNNTFQF